MRQVATLKRTIGKVKGFLATCEDKVGSGDRVIATAILDRVLHHAITLNIRGISYRLK